MQNFELDHAMVQNELFAYGIFYHQGKFEIISLVILSVANVLRSNGTLTKFYSGYAGSIPYADQ